MAAARHAWRALLLAAEHIAFARYRHLIARIVIAAALCASPLPGAGAQRSA